MDVRINHFLCLNQLIFNTFLAFTCLNSICALFFFFFFFFFLGWGGGGEGNMLAVLDFNVNCAIEQNQELQAHEINWYAKILQLEKTA